MTKIVVKNRYDELYEIPSENLSKALLGGYTVLTPNELREINLQKEYGDGGGQFISGLLGAQQAASFGIGTACHGPVYCL